MLLSHNSLYKSALVHLFSRISLSIVASIPRARFTFPVVLIVSIALGWFILHRRWFGYLLIWFLLPPSIIFWLPTRLSTRVIICTYDGTINATCHYYREFWDRRFILIYLWYYTQQSALKLPPRSDRYNTPPCRPAIATAVILRSTHHHHHGI